MNYMKKVENNICDGLVLDDNGRWVPIAHMLAKERELLSQLRKGRVIVGGQWVAIEKALELQRSPSAAQETPPTARVSPSAQATAAAAAAPPRTDVDPHADLVAALSSGDGDGFLVPLSPESDSSPPADAGRPNGRVEEGPGAAPRQRGTDSRPT